MRQWILFHLVMNILWCWYACIGPVICWDMVIVFYLDYYSVLLVPVKIWFNYIVVLTRSTFPPLGPSVITAKVIFIIMSLPWLDTSNFSRIFSRTCISSVLNLQLSNFCLLARFFFVLQDIKGGSSSTSNKRIHREISVSHGRFFLLMLTPPPIKSKLCKIPCNNIIL